MIEETTANDDKDISNNNSNNDKLVIVIHNYPRTVVLSERQRPTYFKYFKGKIKGKNKKVPKVFYKNPQNIPIYLNPNDLSDGYVFCTPTKKGNKGWYIYDSGNDKIPDGAILCNYDGKTVVPVISNRDKVGKPKVVPISGNDLLSATHGYFGRRDTIDVIKKEIIKVLSLKKYPIWSKYPISITCRMYDTVKNVISEDDPNENDPIGMRWDLKNRMIPYFKAFPDVLQEMGIIKDDDRLHVTRTVEEFIPLTAEEAKSSNNRRLEFIIEYDDRKEVIHHNIYLANFGAVQIVNFNKQKNDVHDEPTSNNNEIS